MAPGRLHQFSPQRTAPEDLEAILVGRESVLNSVVAKVKMSASTKNRFHHLLVGSRGIGKTHLLALINHRVQADESLADRIRIAWLNEDETSSRFLHLLIRIFRSLAARYPEEFPDADVRSIMGRDADEALHQLSQILVQRTGNHVILLLIENLDAHFAKFTVAEQRRWRGFMQDCPIFTTVATAQRLFDGIRKQDEIFYGFFDTQHLRSLTVSQTSAMLEKIAALRGDLNLQRSLRTSRGQSRLRVVHFLAGGNPRLYVLLSELITEDSLDDIADTFEAIVDQQLTSYYQERLRWLAPLQQDIVQVLCRHRAAVSVKLIAEELFTTNQSISSQLKELKSFGYVQSTKVGRETHYELAEPLMRLVMQVKETASHQPLLLLIEFLQAWFESDELRQKRTPYMADSPDDLVAEVIAGRANPLISRGEAANAVADLSGVLLHDTADLRSLVNRDVNEFFDRSCGILFVADPAEQFSLGKLLMDRASDLDMQRAIGLALVRQLASFSGSDFNNRQLTTWNHFWQKLAGDIESMIIPLRLLQAGIDYLIEQKSKSLLQLPIEERRIVEHVLGLRDTKSSDNGRVTD